MNTDTRATISSKIQETLKCSIQRANNIERWVHNKYIQKYYTKRAYMRKCRSILWNLERSDILRRQLSQKSVDYESILTQKPWEVMPDLWQETLEKHYQKRIHRYVEYDLQGMYPCVKCKSMKTKHVQVQTRSADEPMTLYVTCMECGKVSKRS